MFENHIDIYYQVKIWQIKSLFLFKKELLRMVILKSLCFLRKRMTFLFFFFQKQYNFFQKFQKQTTCSIIFVDPPFFCKNNIYFFLFLLPSSIFSIIFNTFQKIFHDNIEIFYNFYDFCRIFSTSSKFSVIFIIF